MSWPHIRAGVCLALVTFTNTCDCDHVPLWVCGHPLKSLFLLYDGHREPLKGRHIPKWFYSTLLGLQQSPLSGESHGQRSLVSYSPWDLKESDTAEHAHTLTSGWLCGGCLWNLPEEALERAQVHHSWEGRSRQTVINVAGSHTSCPLAPSERGCQCQA